MKAVLAIDDDVLEAAKAMAEEQHKTVDEIISELARRSIEENRPRETRNNIPLLPQHAQGKPVTMQIVNSLRDENS
jgi:hypothetical protein